MAQRRNSSGRGDERSDLTDVKALAAKARETGGPVLKQNAAELSGVRPRRDSVIGMRLTPPPRTTTSELPNWFWGVLGCLSVLLVGFAALFFLGRSGKLASLLGNVGAFAVAPVAAPPVVAPAEEPAPAPLAPAPAAAVEPPARPRAEHAERAERLAAAERAAAAPPPPPPSAAPAEAAPTAAAPTDPTGSAAPAEPVAVDEGAKRAREHAAAPVAAKAHAAKAGDSPAADDQDDPGVDTADG